MTTLIFLAGGSGLRFGGSSPKQFLKLKEKEIALYSLEVLLANPQITESVIVTAPEYIPLFLPTLQKYPSSHQFALPGKRRQDSVANGFSLISAATEWVCIHDAARPFISKELVDRLLAVNSHCRAATVAMQVTSTIKECNGEGWVDKTLNRERLWEIQTPQLVHREILEEGFKVAKAKDLTVTDDVSLAELLGYPVKLVEGSPYNIKITRREDFLTAERIAECCKNTK